MGVSVDQATRKGWWIAWRGNWRGISSRRLGIAEKLKERNRRAGLPVHALLWYTTTVADNAVAPVPLLERSCNANRRLSITQSFRSRWRYLRGRMFSTALPRIASVVMLFPSLSPHRLYVVNFCVSHVLPLPRTQTACCVFESLRAEISCCFRAPIFFLLELCNPRCNRKRHTG